MKRPPVRRATGASLIEVLIATLVVGLVLTSIAFLMSLNVKSSQEAELRAQAAIFSQQGVDSVRRYWANNTWSTFKSANLSSLGCSTTLSFAGVSFARTCDLSVATATCPVSGNLASAADCGTSDNRCRLRVHVSWTSGGTTTDVCTVQDFFNR